MLPQKKIEVVIPAYNRKAITLDCITRMNAIKKEGFDIEIIVVDDGSTDGTGEAISRAFPGVKVLRGNGNLWWSGATNLGIKYALQNSPDYILTLNDDVEFESDFIVRMLETARENTKAIICCLVCYKNKKNTVLSAGRYRSGFLGYKTLAHYANCSKAFVREDVIESELESGYAMLIPAQLFSMIGLFDDKYFPHHMGDMDFVLRAREAGFRVLVNTRARLYAIQGENYLYNVLVEKSFFQVAKSIFSIKSNAYWRTRLNFMVRHTRPRLMVLVAFGHYAIRMCIMLLMKLLLPKTLMRRIVFHRYGLLH